MITPKQIEAARQTLLSRGRGYALSADDMRAALEAAEREAHLPQTAVIIGPNTLSGTPQGFSRDGRHGDWGEFCTPGDWGEFYTPWYDGQGQEFDSNATRVAIWFRTWDEAQAFVGRWRPATGVLPGSGGTK